MQNKFRSPYGDRLKVTVNTGTKSLVQQNAKDECDVNKILERFNKTGQLPNMIKQNPQFGDFTLVADYQESLNQVMFAQEQFAGLPSKVRARFENDPAQFLAFATNPQNLEGMIELGLAKRPAKNGSEAPQSSPAGEPPKP